MAVDEKRVTRGKIKGKYDIGEKNRQDIEETFHLFDKEGNGFIESSKLKLAMRSLGFEPKREEIKKIMEEYDKDKKGSIEYQDFCSLMSKKISEKDINEEILKAFRLFDTKNSGKIGFDDLKRVSIELGEKLTDEELHEMIIEADRDGDSFVDKEEFLRIMKKTCLY